MILVTVTIPMMVVVVAVIIRIAESEPHSFPRNFVPVVDWEGREVYGGWNISSLRGTPGTEGKVAEALYDLYNDPMEKVNLAEKEPEKAAAMLKRLMEYHINVSTVTYPPADERGDPRHLDGVWNSGWC